MEKILFFLSLTAIGAGAGLILAIFLKIITLIFRKKLSLETKTNYFLIIGLIIVGILLILLDFNEPIGVGISLYMGSSLGSVLFSKIIS